MLAAVNGAARVPLRIDVATGAGRVTVALSGELDLRTAADFRDAIDRLDREAPPLTVVDLRGLMFMDSAGIGELVRATRHARAAGRRVVLVTGSVPIDRVLAISGVDRVLETTADPASLDN